MSRFPLLMILFSVLVLIGCSKQSGTSSGGGGSSTSTSTGGGGTSTSTSTSSGGGTSTSSSTGGPVNPDPSPQPSVGIPDQNSMTLVAETLNVPSWGIAGVQTSVSVFLADQLNNSSSIPDGTIVYFAAEGGAIGTHCETVNGTCSVTWRSQQPTPVNIPPELAVAGRDTILAWTAGVESFNDNNSNGLFDDGDTRVAGTDVGDPFIDKNENGVRETDEEFVNYPNPAIAAGGTYNGPDGLYSGPNCAHTTDCATNQSVFIYDTLVLTNSSSTIIIHFLDPSLATHESMAIAQPVDLDNGGQNRVDFKFLFTDENGNPPPKGTVISFSTDAGTIVGSSSYTVENTNLDMGLSSPWSAGLVFELTVREDSENTEDVDGDLLINAGANQASIQLFDPANP